MIKQDINFLEKPLWFLKESEEENYVWKDLEGYEYRAGYKIPDKLDMLFLLYMLLKSQKLGYKEKVEFSRYEILKACNRTTDNRSYDRLEDSLKRWLNISVLFDGTFYDGKTYIKIGFHIIQSYRIRNDKVLELHFDPDWLLKIKESQFFKYINFDYYKALKRPVSQRLFEILCKTFKGRESWEIDLVKLGTKLTLFKRKVSTRQGKKEVMYHSDVLVALKPAIHEINKVAENKELFKSLEIPASEAFSLEYHLKRENKIIVFNKRIPNWVKQERSSENGPEAQIKVQTEVEEALPLKQLYEMSKSQTTSVKEAINQYYNEKGFEYVKWNIQYANKTATKSYATFLKKSLKENWGKEFREIEEHKLETEKIYYETKQEQLSSGIKKDKEILTLNSIYKNLPKEEQKKLWESAKEFYLANGTNENFLNKEMIMAQIRTVLKESANTLPIK